METGEDGIGKKAACTSKEEGEREQIVLRLARTGDLKGGEKALRHSSKSSYVDGERIGAN